MRSEDGHVGNAVPPLVAKALAEHFGAIVSGAECEQEPTTSLTVDPLSDHAGREKPGNEIHGDAPASSAGIVRSAGMEVAGNGTTRQT